MDKDKVKKAIFDLLVALGEDTNRKGLIDTPRRVANMYEELLKEPNFGYTVFEEQYNDIVIVKNIDFCSICEHHLLPFYGIAHIAYIPNGKIIGISKLARIVEKYARKLQVQERMTNSIVEDLQSNLGTDDVAVYIEATHMCMIARGVKKINSQTITTKFTGKFENENNRTDFYNLIKI